MHFSEIPEDCVHLIFGRLPLSFLLLSVSLVSRNWHGNARNVCLRVSRLTLVVGDPRKNAFLSEQFRITSQFPANEQDDLTVISGRTLCCANLSWVTVQRLVDTFPNVSSVSIGQYGVTFWVLHKIVHLLEQWATRLHTLHLVCVYAEMNTYSDGEYIHLPGQYGHIEETLSSEFAALFDTLNHRLPALKHFTFEADNQLFPLFSPGSRRTLDLPLLTRLETFHFYSKDGEDLLLDSLERYGASSRTLERISLGNGLTTSRCLHRFLAFPPAFASKWTHLNVAIHNLQLIDLSALYHRFPSLHTTSLSFLNFANSQVLATVMLQLATLPNLLHLKFELNYRELLLPWQEQAQERTPPLPSVRQVTIFLTTQSHLDLHHFPTHQLFPSVETVRLHLSSGYSCAECRQGRPKSRKESTLKWRQCAQQLLWPLKRCTTLRRLYKSYGNDSYEQVNIDEQL